MTALAHLDALSSWALLLLILGGGGLAGFAVAMCMAGAEADRHAADARIAAHAARLKSDEQYRDQIDRMWRSQFNERPLLHVVRDEEAS